MFLFVCYLPLKKVAPPHSHINTLEYKSVSALARYLILFLLSSYCFIAFIVNTS